MRRLCSSSLLKIAAAAVMPPVSGGYPGVTPGRMDVFWFLRSSDLQTLRMEHRCRWLPRRLSGAALGQKRTSVSPAAALYKLAFKPRTCFDVPNATHTVWVRSLEDAGRLREMQEVPTLKDTAVPVQAYLISGQDLRRNVVNGVHPVSEETSSPQQTSTTPPPLDIDPELPASKRRQLVDLLAEYSDCFSTSSKVRQTPMAKHRIITDDDALPVHQSPYRVSLKERKVIQDQVQEMLDDDIIQPSRSPWASPVVLVKKKDGTLRFCVDYRRLNAVTKKDVYPLPRIDDTLDRLRHSRYFSSMDLKSGYWQIEVDERDREKTAFVTPDGLYEFKVMPFGLCTAPATFQRVMDTVLAGLKWQSCLYNVNHTVAMRIAVIQRLKNEVQLNPLDELIEQRHQVWVLDIGVVPAAAALACYMTPSVPLVDLTEVLPPTWRHSQHLTKGTTVGHVEELQAPAVVTAVSEETSSPQQTSTTPPPLDIDPELPARSAGNCVALPTMAWDLLAIPDALFLIYADAVTVWTSYPSLERQTQGLQTVLNSTIVWWNSVGLNVSSEKTACISIANMRGRPKLLQSPLQLALAGRIPSEVSTLRVLGADLSASGLASPSLRAASKSTTSMLHLFRRIAERSEGA
ncbi:retrovirus-related Pol polyprotein from transposon 17.6 [Ixodes scapularis]